MKPHFRLGMVIFGLLTSACGSPEDPLAEAPETPNFCKELHFAHIVSPIDGAEGLDPSTPMVVRWSSVPMEGIPDAFTSMQHGPGSFDFIGPSKQEMHGSTGRYSYELKPNTTHTFQIGWDCFENGESESIVLDTITFKTSP